MTVMARGWSILAGPLTIWFIARHLSPFDQGIYYTFWSILAARVFFDLGVGNVVLLAASHENAVLSWDTEGKLSGEPLPLARLAAILHSSTRFYGVAALLVLLVLLPVGFAFLSNGTSGSSHWQAPWIALCLLGSLSLGISCLISLLEGCGLVAKIARIRLLSAILMTATTWSSLTVGWGLWAAPLAVFADLTVQFIWLITTKRRVVSQLWGTLRPTADVFSWKREIWPLQWRAAISFASGYLMFQLFNPLLFHFRSPEEAGQMGMSSNLAGAVLSIALAWINTKAAPFGNLIAHRRWPELDQIFFRSLLQSTLVFLAGAGTLLLFVFAANAWATQYAVRLLDPATFTLLLFATLGNQIWFSFVVYLRAHKKDPFVALTLISAFAIAGGSLAVAARYGAPGVMLVYALVTWIVGVGFGFHLFSSLRKKWHAPLPENV